ncbi:AMP-binding protein [Rhodococcus oxybenzonivorans]|uniref:class I adenylate-forming enzyme family protein n=1 Tax=Rhodococcus oxybenzonivorans TaxID=1990687 RepID=UPI002954F796|nr:AMP-binding protein [Rhodococcus oxybenzonivorans]MDV7352785.1 AMP-binding protein [Rhodococcus oxybenzonivorans]
MSISLLLEMAVSGNPDRVAIVVDDTTLTYQQFADRVSAAGSVISQADVETVVYLGGSGFELPILVFASAYAGVPFTPVNYRLSTEQIHELIGRLPKPLVVAESAYLDAVSGSAGRIISVDEFRARSEAVDIVEPATVDPDAPAIVLFTSGTTSAPKGVVLRHSHLLSYVMGTVEFASADEFDGALVSVPPYHVAGMGTILTNLYAGRRIIYLPHFDVRRWLELARSTGATSAMVVPTMLDMIVDHLGGAEAEVSTLKSLSYGGARMPLPTLEAALRAFPGVGFVNAYGLTETSSTIALLGPDDHREALASDDPAVRARLGSIGRPVPGIEVVIRDADGTPVGAGEHGELWVRGPQVSGEYMGSGSVLDSEGWFPTKDLAYQDADGFLFVIGRNDDTIIRGGENIAPAEIEDVLVHHPKVRSVVVVGIPDDRWGQAIAATVVLEPGDVPDPEELRQYVRARLRGSRTPDRIVYRSDLPTTATGKILRRNIIKDIIDNTVTAVSA